MNGALARGLQSWSSRAATSLPTPAGPVISTRLPVPATRFSVARTALIATLEPVSSVSCPICALQRLIFAPQPLGLGRARDEMEQMAGLERLFDEVRPRPARIAATAVSRLPWPEIISTGSVGSRRLISSSSCSPSSFEPCSQTSSRTSDGRRSAERRERLAAVGGGAGGIALVLEHPGHEIPNVLLVVDNENV